MRIRIRLWRWMTPFSAPLAWVPWAVVLSVAVLTVLWLRVQRDDPVWPEPGIYGPDQYVVGKYHADPADTQTLKIILGVDVDELHISDANLGAAGISSALKILAGPGQRIRCDTFALTELATKSLAVTDSTFHELFLTSNVADGNSYTLTVATTTDVTIASGRGRPDLIISADDYDRVEIDGASNGTQVRDFLIERVKTFGGPVEISNLTCGIATMATSTIGSGSGINSADNVWAVDVGSATLSGNVEEPTSIE